MTVTGPLRWIVLIILWGVLPPSSEAANVWPPVASSDLAMREFVAQPGASAVILDRTLDSDTTKNSADAWFVRIKVLTEAGEDRGNIRIRYVSSLSDATDIEARTIEPDGTIHVFNGRVFDRVLAQSRDLAVHEKRFAMPDVRVGSIIDYRYRIVWKSGFEPLPTWTIQSDLFIRHEHFSVRSSGVPITWIARGLDPQHHPVEHPSSRSKTRESTLTLDEENVTPVANEPYSLPRAELVGNVKLFYALGMPTAFWARFGRENAKATEKYIGKPKDLESLVATIVGGTNRPEAKLRAIYAYLLTFRNLTLEAVRSSEVQDASHLKENKSVRDVLQRRYGYSEELNMAFVAMARAAGFQAWLVLDSSRDGEFFSKSMEDFRQLDGSLAEVKVGNENKFYDPGRGCPFGVIPWFRTAVTGIRLERESGVFETTAPPSSALARIDRTGHFHLNPDGALQGTLAVSYQGSAAYQRTLAALTMDEAARNQKLVDEIRQQLPDRAVVHLERVNGWSTSELELNVVFAVAVPGFAHPVGTRLMFSQGVLETTSSPKFPSPQRQGLVYFHAPSIVTDDIRIELPNGYRVESLPDAMASPSSSALRYQAAVQTTSTGLEWHRVQAIHQIIFPVKSYPAVRAFFATSLQNDQRQVALRSGESGETRPLKIPARLPAEPLHSQ